VGELQQQMALLGELQQRLLPHALPTLPGWAVAVDCSVGPLPGGDYYDFLPLAGGRLMFVVADASGHGAPAAVMMAMTRVVVHSCPLSSGQSHAPFCPLERAAAQPPHVLLGHLNRILVENTLEGHFMTAFCGVVDPAAGMLHFANAGHPVPRRWRASTRTVAALPDIGGLPLGIEEDVAYAETRIKIERGDVLLCYTDGVTEACNPQGEMFGCQRLNACLASGALRGTVAVKDAVLRGLEGFLDGAVPHDDRTVLVIGRHC
jgi:sigma-B regulation protein RsbU (phosphoserine phosphatase)